ncbi:MBL fold metallo-hydrolase [Candidatus Latescibacterota bacterium]
MTLLGTGTSVGVPRIACDCAVCTSPDPRNQRLRCSILMEAPEGSILVDTTPDLRQQVLRHGLRELDAVLYTHAHADHLHGLDDVRCFCFQRDTPLPCYGDEATLLRIRHVFDYAFQAPTGSSRPSLELRGIDGPLSLLGLDLEPIPVLHGHMPILAYRTGGFAYVTDCSAIPPASMEALRGLDVLILDALRHRQHPTHFSLSQALKVAVELAPHRTYFTHIAHDLDHQTTNSHLPPGVELAYDGLALDVD